MFSYYIFFLTMCFWTNYAFTTNLISFSNWQRSDWPLLRIRKTTASKKSCDFFAPMWETVYVDNCANCHISNNILHFINYTPCSASDTSGCSIIGGGTQAAGHGIVRWSWRNDNGRNFVYELLDCRHYPDSPFCILSQTQLVLLLKDDDFGTKIESGIYTSRFFGIISSISKRSSTLNHSCPRWSWRTTSRLLHPLSWLSFLSLIMTLVALSSLTH